MATALGVSIAHKESLFLLSSLQQSLSRALLTAALSVAVALQSAQLLKFHHVLAVFTLAIWVLASEATTARTGQLECPQLITSQPILNV